MTLELTIQEMFNEYPTLFKERSDCLDHLFCGIGNGYEWIDGELCDNVVGCEPEPEYIEHLKTMFVDGKAHQYNKMSLRAEAIHYAKTRKKEDYPESIRKELEAADEKYFARLPDDIYHKRERKYRWYFYLAGYCKQFAFLFNYPDDIKPDWLAGIEECKAMLVEDGYDFDEQKIDTKANWEEAIQFERAWIRRENGRNKSMLHACKSTR